MLNELRLYFRLIKIHLLSGMEYKGWPFTISSVVFYCISEPFVIIMMFSRFGNIGGWTLERILLIYSIALTSFGFAKILCNGFDYFPWYMVRSGDFDRLLLRPKSLVVQVAGSYCNIQRMGNPIGGLVIMIWMLSRLGVTFSLQDVVMLALALIGGFMVYAGVYVMSSGISFFTIGDMHWIYVFSNASFETTRIPVDHMPSVLRNMFTFLMPMLVISYFPASAIGGWGGSYWRGWLALPAGVAFLAVSMLVWRIGVKHYKSTGS